MPLRDILLALMAVAILGGNFIFVKLGLTEVPPLLLTGLRFAFAAIPAVFFVPRPSIPIRYLISFGLSLGVVQFGLLFTAIDLGMPAGLSSLVIQLQVFFTVALSVLILHERPAWQQIAGAVVAAAGLITIAVGKAYESALIPFGLVIASAMAWSVANIIVKFAGKVNPFAFVAWSSLAAPLPLFVLSLIFEPYTEIVRALTDPSLISLTSVLFLAYPASILAFGLWTNLVRRHPAAVVMPYALLIPIFGIGSTHLAFGEQLTMFDAIGGIIVFIGLVINTMGARLVALLPSYR